ncbi:hypothetical protein ACLB2K_060967 [Fragaria x ananassa]
MEGLIFLLYRIPRAISPEDSMSHLQRGLLAHLANGLRAHLASRLRAHLASELCVPSRQRTPGAFFPADSAPFPFWPC